jgi:iron-sulfur cluster assembly protein
MITLTEKAARKVISLAEKKGLPPVIRVKVGTGGCSGLSYEFVVCDAPASDDAVFEAHGAKAVVDPRSDFFIGGSQVDYVETLMESGFVVKNPQAASTCSCGKSFSTAS